CQSDLNRLFSSRRTYTDFMNTIEAEDTIAREEIDPWVGLADLPTEEHDIMEIERRLTQRREEIGATVGSNARPFQDEREITEIDQDMSSKSARWQAAKFI